MTRGGQRAVLRRARGGRSTIGALSEDTWEPNGVFPPGR